jgi:hypothetical protein
MKKREFNKYLKQISDNKKKLLDIQKIKILPLEIREQMVKHLVRNRLPIVRELIPEYFDWNWLVSMGYLYQTKGKYFEFVHTSEHRIT